MAKKSRLDRILEERKKQQKANTTRNTRTISTGLPSARQQIIIPRNTTTEVQSLARSLFKRNDATGTTTQNVMDRINNYNNSMKQGYIQTNGGTVQDKIKNYQQSIKNGYITDKLVAKKSEGTPKEQYKQSQIYNDISKGTSVISKEDKLSKEYLNKIKQEENAQNQLKMLQIYNDVSGDNKSTTQIKKEIKDAETVNKINNGNTVEKVFNTAKFLGQGFTEGAVATLDQINATAQNISGTNTNYDFVKKMNEYASSYQQNLQNVDNGLVRFGGQVTNTVGGMLPAIGMNIIAPGTGSIVSGVSAGSSAYLETLHENQDNKDKAMLTGILKGTLAGSVDKLIGGDKIGTGALDKWAVKQIAKVKNEVAQKLLAKSYEVLGEVAEEEIENLAGYLVDMVVNNKKVTVEDVVRDLIDTSGTTAGATLLLSALGLGGTTFKDVQELNPTKQQIKNSGLTKNQQQLIEKTAEKYGLNQNEVQYLIDNTKNGKYAENQGTTIENKPISEQGQQTIQTEGKIDEKAISQEIDNDRENIQKQVKIDSENFAKQVDEVKNGTFAKRDMLTLLTKTPKPLLDIGLNDFPITMTQKHLDTIMNKDGKNIGANYHNLGEKIIKQLPEAISNPLDIMESSTKDDSIVLTTYLSDNQDRNIIASIKIDGTGRINDIEIDSNVMTSAYGRNNYEKWMQDNIDNGRLLYDIDRGTIKKVTRSRLQLPRTSNSVDTVDNVSTSTNIIPQNDNNMQDNFQDIRKEQPKKISEVLKPKKKVSEVLPKQTTQAEKRQLVDEVYREDIAEGKVRKHYKSVFDSDQVGKVGKDVAKELLKKDTYVPVSNLETITAVNDNISRNGIGATYNAFRTKIRSNEKITLQDVATGERLIQIYSQKGDYAKVNELIQDVAILGTELGQQVQAFNLIKRASPEGQLQYLTKLMERTNIKENTNIKITEEMSEKILKSKNQEELEQNMSEVAIELASQIPLTAKDKIRSWRYLSMLGNLRTHIKNLGANVAMNLTQRVKNVVAGVIEGVTSAFNPEMERTKTLNPANKEQRTFAKQDAELMKDLIDAGGKYDVKNIIQNSKKQFDNRVLNAIAEFNSNLLDKEDKIFLKSAYKMAMQNYMSANNLKASDMEGKTLEKARQYASLQAQEATFHEFNAVANTLSQLENKGGLVGGATSAILPFKKTPMNIAKAGVQYSPVGLASAVIYDVAQIAKKTKTYKQQLADGKITEAEYKSETSKMVNKTIDNMAKGLTGTSLAVLGLALAKHGVIKAGNDGEDDEFKEKLGEQEYAITIGDNTYTLDWVSPSAIPLFTGATIYQLITGDEDEQKSILNSTLTAFSKTFEPMTDMSMLQGLTSAITSYEQGSSNMLFDLGASMITSYAGQFIPTLSGQVARITDPYERDTSTTKKGIEGKVDRFAKQTINKIPGASRTLDRKTDIWGEDVKRPENLVQRTLETAVLPWTRKKLTEDRTAQELLKVFDESGENVLPGTPSKDLTINKEKYRMTTEEYNKAKKDFGQTSKGLLDDLFKSSTYNSLTPEGKAKAIEDVYSYAKEKLKVDYAEKINEDIKTSTLYNTVETLIDSKADVSAYFEFKGKMDDLDREKGDEEVKKQEKLEYLHDMKTTDKTKRIIYQDTLGTTDKVYKYLSQLTNNKVSINQYLDYKTQGDLLKADDDPNSIVKGKTISGSKKKKVINYLNNSDFTAVERLYIYGTQYAFNSAQKQQFTGYVNKAKQAGRLSEEEEIEMYKKLNSVQELENGQIRWK